MFCYTPVTQMCSLRRNEKNTCENSSTKSMQKNFLVERGDVQLEHSIAHGAPSFQKCPRQS